MQTANLIKMTHPYLGRRIQNTHAFGEYLVQSVDTRRGETMLYNFLTQETVPFVLSRTVAGLQNGSWDWMDKEKKK